VEEPSAAWRRPSEVNREIAKYVDVMIGNEEDFTACLGFEVEGRRREPHRHRDRQLQGDDRDGA
jgi:sugar/nucleoside kinase (ribokinase family)